MLTSDINVIWQTDYLHEKKDALLFVIFLFWGILFNSNTMWEDIYQSGILEEKPLCEK